MGKLVGAFEEECIPAFESGKLKVVIGKQFKMTDLPSAMDYASNN